MKEVFSGYRHDAITGIGEAIQWFNHMTSHDVEFIAGVDEHTQTQCCGNRCSPCDGEDRCHTWLSTARENEQLKRERIPGEILQEYYRPLILTGRNWKHLITFLDEAEEVEVLVLKDGTVLSSCQSLYGSSNYLGTIRNESRYELGIVTVCGEVVWKLYSINHECTH